MIRHNFYSCLMMMLIISLLLSYYRMCMNVQLCIQLAIQSVLPLIVIASQFTLVKVINTIFIINISVVFVVVFYVSVLSI